MSSETMLVCPSYHGTQLDIRKDTTKKGEKYYISYWKGFDKIHVNGYFTDEEFELTKEKCILDKNKNTDIFEIRKSDITEDMLKYFRYVQPSIQYEKQDVLIDPYILGSWLGDGTSVNFSITNIDTPIIDYWYEYAKQNDMKVTIRDEKQRVNEPKEYETSFIACYTIVNIPLCHVRITIDEKVYDVKTITQPESISEINKILQEHNLGQLMKSDFTFIFSNDASVGSQRFKKINKHLQVIQKTDYENKFMGYMKHYNLINNKHIPKEYLENDEDTRLKVLAGIVDTDGSLNYSSYDIIQKNKCLSDEIVTLCTSLGFNTSISECRKACKYKGEQREGTYYRITVQLDQFSKTVPVLLDRKRWIDTGRRCNKRIHLNGDINKFVQNNWSDALDILLYSYAESFKEIEPNQQIPWTTIQSMCDDFLSFTNAALQTRYSKVLITNKDKFDNLRIPLAINPIDSEWIHRYNTLFDLIRTGRQTQHDMLWLYSQQSHASTLYLSKKILMEDMYGFLLNNDWITNLEALDKFIGLNGTYPTKKHPLINFLNVQLTSIKKKCGGPFVSTARKDLWNEFVRKHHDLIKLKHFVEIEISLSTDEPVSSSTISL